MADVLPAPEREDRSTRRAVRLAAVAVFGLFALALVLWARYGGAVFVEMLSAAWAACF